MPAPDIIYPYKRAPNDFELRYSLRSLVNVPHSRVIIAGDSPFCVNDRVTVVKNPRVSGDRYMSSTSNIFAAMARADVSDEFVVMNDDIFVLKPWTFKHEHRATIAECLADPAFAGEYRARMVSTAAILRSVGITEPLFFGLHTPTVYNRHRLADMIREYPMPQRRYLTRTLYWNLFPAPSVRRTDVKVKTWPIESMADDVLSISDNVTGISEFQTWINERFPVASRYETL